jgi:hypothetical protein
MGRADAEALSHHDYSGNTPLKMQGPQPTNNTKPTQPTKTNAKEKRTEPVRPTIGQRKLILE